MENPRELAEAVDRIRAKLTEGITHLTEAAQELADAQATLSQAVQGFDAEEPGLALRGFAEAAAEIEQFIGVV
ncbi:hypothetical protein [Amycolatopsis sp. NPDC058986]|uniref:hypothetical protein n=1 Tax=unclassified Amycolatopsis TaxID=2618356 RepID=UPI00366A9814